MVIFLESRRPRVMTGLMLPAQPQPLHSASEVQFQDPYDVAPPPLDPLTL
jgi:hypothetical protein